MIAAETSCQEGAETGAVGGGAGATPFGPAAPISPCLFSFRIDATCVGPDDSAFSICYICWHVDAECGTSPRLYR
jgi:hypothetical protein